MFDGFPREMIAFFASLSYNNNRTFFEENKHVYERAVLQPLTALCQALAPVIREIDPLLDTRPARSVSRIYRDVRFSKNKSPYREYMWIGYRRAGETREDTCGFYFDVSATAANWGCGYYHAQKETMQNLRETITRRPAYVLDILREETFMDSFSLMGERYARKNVPPQELPEPLGELYRMKNVYAEHHLDDMDLLFSKDLCHAITEGYRTLAPFYTLLRDCMVRRDEGV